MVISENVISKEKRQCISISIHFLRELHTYKEHISVVVQLKNWKCVSYKYNSTSSKRPTKMLRFSGCLQEVVAYKNETTGVSARREPEATNNGNL